jgi:hypothetical protein
MSSFRLRYDVTTLQASTPITYGDIAGLLATKSGAASATGILLMFEAVKLREVHLWGPAVINSANNTIGIESAPLLATNSAPSENQSFVPGVDTTRTNESSTSNTGSSHIKWVPKGLSASWINPASVYNPTLLTDNQAGLQAMFTVTAPQYSVLDIIVDSIVSDGSFPVIYSSTEVTALIPGTYALGLGFAGGSAKIVPQDFNVYD